MALADDSEASGRLLGWVTACTVLVLDAVVALLSAARVLASPGSAIVVLAGGRILLVFFGARYISIALRERQLHCLPLCLWCSPLHHCLSSLAPLLTPLVARGGNGAVAVTLCV